MTLKHTVKAKKLVIVAHRTKHKNSPISLSTYVYDLFNNKVALATSSSPWWKGEMNITKSEDEPHLDQCSFIIEGNSPVHHMFFVANCGKDQQLQINEELQIDVMAEISVNNEIQRAPVSQYTVKVNDNKSGQYCVGYLIRDVQTDEFVLFKNGFSVSNEQSVTSHLPVKPAKIVAKVIRAASLYPMDYNGLSDPYAIVKFDKEKLKTKTIKATLDPVWNEDLIFKMPDKDTEISIQVWDWDLLSSDDFEGAVYIKLSDIVPSHVYSQNLGPRKKKEQEDLKVNGTIDYQFQFIGNELSKPSIAQIIKFTPTFVRLTIAKGLGFHHRHAFSKATKSCTCRLSFLGNTLETKEGMPSQDPSWNEEFIFEYPPADQLNTALIQLQVFGKPDGREIGVGHLKFNQVTSNQVEYKVRLGDTEENPDPNIVQVTLIVQTM